MSIIPNTIPDGQYSGTYYAYEGSGGFVIEQGVGITTITPFNKVNKYDVTNALQIQYDVRTFNTKLGLRKDASNATILSTSYNETTNTFQDRNGVAIDSISITASEFSNAVMASNIISVGFYSTMYANFKTLVNNYFGFPQGFNALFTTASTTNINGGVFDASAMVNLLHYSVQNASGQYIKTTTGTVTISNINSLLRYAGQNNTFGNRTSPTDQQTIVNGFLENDLVYIPYGTTITLVANISNSDTPNNNILPTSAGLASILASCGTGEGPQDFTNNEYSQTTTFTSSSITRVIHVPILLVLKNLS
jgi:hypothetical protein